MIHVRSTYWVEQNGMTRRWRELTEIEKDCGIKIRIERCKLRRTLIHRVNYALSDTWE